MAAAEIGHEHGPPLRLADDGFPASSRQIYGDLFQRRVIYCSISRVVQIRPPVRLPLAVVSSSARPSEPVNKSRTHFEQEFKKALSRRERPRSGNPRSRVSSHNGHLGRERGSRCPSKTAFALRAGWRVAALGRDSTSCRRRRCARRAPPPVGVVVQRAARQAAQPRSSSRAVARPPRGRVRALYSAHGIDELQGRRPRHDLRLRDGPDVAAGVNSDAGTSGASCARPGDGRAAKRRTTASGGDRGTARPRGSSAHSGGPRRWPAAARSPAGNPAFVMGESSSTRSGVPAEAPLSRPLVPRRRRTPRRTPRRGPGRAGRSCDQSGLNVSPSGMGNAGTYARTARHHRSALARIPGGTRPPTPRTATSRPPPQRSAAARTSCPEAFRRGLPSITIVLEGSACSVAIGSYDRSMSCPNPSSTR